MRPWKNHPSNPGKTDSRFPIGEKLRLNTKNQKGNADYPSGLTICSQTQAAARLCGYASTDTINPAQGIRTSGGCVRSEYRMVGAALLQATADAFHLDHKLPIPQALFEFAVIAGGPYGQDTAGLERGVDSG